MKKLNLITLIILLIMISKLLYAGTYSGGNGTLADPYQIATTDDLIELSKTNTDWVSGKYFIQTANIAFAAPHLVDWDGNGQVEWDGPDEFGFKPIGNNSVSFRGEFNGNNFTISNLYIYRAGNHYIGFFGHITNAAIQNIKLNFINFTGANNIGGIVGYVNGQSGNGSEVINCQSSGIIYSVSYTQFGVVYGDYVGGIAGYLNNNSSISKCYSNVFVTGSNYIGGVVGSMSSNSECSESYSKGRVDGVFNVGGFVGSISNTCIISNCYTLSNVYRKFLDQTSFGAFCGNNNSGTIQNCYSTGSVFYISTNPTDKGFVGYNSNGVYENNFWDNDLSNQNTAVGATSKTTKEMKTQITFTSWDFTETTGIWRIESGNYSSYPFFQSITYDTYFTNPEINPIPGLTICQNTVYVNSSYTSQTSGWGITHFDNLTTALENVCTPGKINISNYTHNGDVDMTGITYIIGEQDFTLNGNLSGGLIQATNTGKLIMKDLSENIPKTFPITDGTYNYTMTITTSDANSPDISVRIKNNNQTGNINSDFWDIYGPDNLDATATFRVDKAAIAPKKINSNTQLRYFDGKKYTPVNGDNFSVEEFDTYYIITITGVDKF